MKQKKKIIQFLKNIFLKDTKKKEQKEIKIN